MIDKNITYDSFIKRMVALSAIVIVILFAIYSYFIQSRSIKQSLKSETNIMVNLIFNNLYTAMSSGATKQELDNIVQELEKKIPDSAINIYKSRLQANSKHAHINDVFQSKESSIIQEESMISFASPIIFEQKCLKCHTYANVGDIASVIEFKYPIMDLNLSLKDILVLILVLFSISIIVVFILWYTFLNKYFIYPIKSMIEQMNRIKSHKDLSAKIKIDTIIYEVKEIESVFNSQNKKLYRSYSDLEEMSNTDKLTGVYNRKKFDEIIEYELANAQRYKYQFCLVIIDLNKFKEINDTYGHNAGDFILVEFSRIVMFNIRSSDMLFRVGGDEFILLMPHTSNDGAITRIEKLKEMLQDLNLQYQEEPLTISASFGVAVYPEDATNLKELYNLADEKMYLDKKSLRLERDALVT